MHPKAITKTLSFHVRAESPVVCSWCYALQLFGYSDESNPFGDTDLTKAFVWKKKYEKMVDDGVDPSTITKKQVRLKQIELSQEIEKVRARRKQREEEEEAKELMREQMQREIEMEQNADWEEREGKVLKG